MRIFLKTVAFLIVFLAVLVWQFPYETLMERSIRRAEASTGATILYQPVSASLFGVRVSDLQITLPSGPSINFDSARIFPTRRGMRATAYQGENEMAIRLTPTRIELNLVDINVDTGSEVVGTARVTGELGYALAAREGEGALRLVVPELKLALPIPETSVEIGSSFVIRNVAEEGPPRTGVSAEVKLLSGDNLFTANGTISMQSMPPPYRPELNGNLRFEAPTGRGTLRLGGNWDKPVTSIIPN